MPFTILYIEDRRPDWNRLNESIVAHNATRVDPDFSIVRAETPEAAKPMLDLQYDAVIADVYFPASVKGRRVDRLADIVRLVREADGARGGRPTPIIAYTGEGRSVLQACLNVASELYDIWDKNTARPEYVVWRLTRLAREVSRDRPDALLQRLVRQMPEGASWHKQVQEMAMRYDAGWTERDQVASAGGAIVAVGQAFGLSAPVESMWDEIINWDPFVRAASASARGHARHLINVFG